MKEKIKEEKREKKKLLGDNAPQKVGADGSVVRGYLMVMKRKRRQLRQRPGNRLLPTLNNTALEAP